MIQWTRNEGGITFSFPCHAFPNEWTKEVSGKGKEAWQIKEKRWRELPIKTREAVYSLTDNSLSLHSSSPNPLLCLDWRIIKMKIWREKKRESNEWATSQWVGSERKRTERTRNLLSKYLVFSCRPASPYHPFISLIPSHTPTLPPFQIPRCYTVVAGEPDVVRKRMNEENGERIGRDPAHSLFLFSVKCMLLVMSSARSHPTLSFVHLPEDPSTRRGWGQHFTSHSFPSTSLSHLIPVDGRGR